MNQVLVAVLALCALPCAVGLYCYSCTPDNSKLCTMEGDLTMVNCTGENATCDMTDIVSNASISPKSYVLGCGNSSTCDAKNTTICTAAATVLRNNMLGLTKCVTTCNTANNSNKPELVMPSPSTQVWMSTTPGSSGPSSTQKPSAGDKLRPAFGVLFMVLLTVILSNPARQ